jgi:hypothetical protein
MTPMYKKATYINRDNDILHTMRDQVQRDYYAYSVLFTSYQDYVTPPAGGPI